jgi:hypothetical protein
MGANPAPVTGAVHDGGSLAEHELGDLFRSDLGLG